MAIIQPLRDILLNNLSSPDKIDTKELTSEKFNRDFIISRDINGNILSRYADDVWDLSTYNNDFSSNPKFNFHENFSIEQREECKKIFFLLYCQGSGRKNSTLSINSLQNYNSLLFNIAIYSDNNKIKTRDILTEEYHLLNFIKNNMPSYQAKVLLSLLNFFKNKSSFVKYRENKIIIDLLSKISNSNKNNSKKTITIPSRILNNSIKERWKQIDEIEKNLHNICAFLSRYLNSSSFAYINRDQKNIDKSNAVEWKIAVEEYELKELFNKYNITERQNFKRLITKIQGTSYHLMLVYSGMRKSECLYLANNCFEKTNKNSVWLTGSTTKLEGQRKQVRWVTTKKIERVIHILNSINSIIGEHHNIALNDMPLFTGLKYVLSENFKKHSMYKGSFAKTDVLQIDENKIKVTKEDFEEIKDIDFTIDESRVKIGDAWKFTPHQYRRSLAVYAIQSGIVSLGALQIQFKHLFREMTLYYSSGSSFAKKLFDDGIKEHISSDMQKLEPELQALAYIKEVLFSDERLYGLHGKVVENSIKKDNDETLRYSLLENREKTIKRFKNGEIAYKSTALGGCIATEACDSRLTRSITACFDCYGGILKKSKVDKVIEKQKQFIEFLDKDSIEYKTEIDDLKTLKDMSKKLIGE